MNCKKTLITSSKLMFMVYKGLFIIILSEGVGGGGGWVRN